MRTTLRWLIAVALLCAVAVAGCGGDDDEAESESTADGGDGGNGAGGDGGGGGVPGSPIDVPSFTNVGGLRLEEVLPRIERDITDLCGGEMCLVLRVEMSVEDREECRFAGTVPPAGGQVERGGTLVVLAGTQPCEGEPPAGDDGDSGGDESPDDDTGNTDDGTDDQPADDNNDPDDPQVPEETP